MNLERADRDISGPFPTKRIIFVAILLLILAGGLFHHHESASDSDGCSYCHAGIQPPVIDLSGALIAPTFSVVGTVTARRPIHQARIFHFSLLAPRAPPLPTHSTVFGEGWTGLV